MTKILKLGNGFVICGRYTETFFLITSTCPFVCWLGGFSAGFDKNYTEPDSRKT